LQVATNLKIKEVVNGFSLLEGVQTEMRLCSPANGKTQLINSDITIGSGKMGLGSNDHVRSDVKWTEWGIA